MARGIEKLHPNLIPICNEFVLRCRAAGLPVLITETLRTKAEQDALYAQGRTAPGSIVTNARYPRSAHCWGVAFDFCRNVKGREYDDSDGFFAKCGAVGKALGLTWGGDWKSFVDKPHLEMPEYMKNSSTSWLISTYGTPEEFFKTWAAEQPEEEDTMTQEQFDAMMDDWLARRAALEGQSWSEDDREWAQESGVVQGDGKNMGWQSFPTKEQVCAMIRRAK